MVNDSHSTNMEQRWWKCRDASNIQQKLSSATREHIYSYSLIPPLFGPEYRSIEEVKNDNILPKY